MNRTIASTLAHAQSSVPSAASALAGKPHSSLDKANADFDGMVLKTCVEAMLPRNASSVYGRGTAGEIWKSYLAEHIARELGQSGQIRILGAGR